MSNTVLNEIFSTLVQDRENHMDFSFASEDDLDNNEAMTMFLEDHDLENAVAEDDGTLVFLEHADYEFQVAVESEGLGDFFSHGIFVSVGDDYR